MEILNYTFDDISEDGWQSSVYSNESSNNNLNIKDPFFRESIIDYPYDNNEINKEKSKSNIKEIEITDENSDRNNGPHSNINTDSIGNNNKKIIININLKTSIKENQITNEKSDSNNNKNSNINSSSNGNNNENIIIKENPKASNNENQITNEKSDSNIKENEIIKESSDSNTFENATTTENSKNENPDNPNDENGIINENPKINNNENQITNKNLNSNNTVIVIKNLKINNNGNPTTNQSSDNLNDENETTNENSKIDNNENQIINESSDNKNINEIINKNLVSNNNENSTIKENTNNNNIENVIINKNLNSHKNENVIINENPDSNNNETAIINKNSDKNNNENSIINDNSDSNNNENSIINENSNNKNNNLITNENSDNNNIENVIINKSIDSDNNENSIINQCSNNKNENEITNKKLNNNNIENLNINEKNNINNNLKSSIIKNEIINKKLISKINQNSFSNVNLNNGNGNKNSIINQNLKSNNNKNINSNNIDNSIINENLKTSINEIGIINENSDSNNNENLIKNKNLVNNNNGNEIMNKSLISNNNNNEIINENEINNTIDNLKSNDDNNSNNNENLYNNIIGKLIINKSINSNTNGNVSDKENLNINKNLISMKNSNSYPYDEKKSDNNIEGNLIWLDSNVDNNKNLSYQEEIKNKFNVSFYGKTEDCISKLKSIDFEKTFILVSDSLSKELFRGLKKVINEIKTCPEIIVFINDNHLEAAKKIILILEKYPLFDIKLVFDEFIKVKNKLLLKNDYKPNYKDYKDINTLDYENCFTFDYVKESKDLIFPLEYTKSIDDANNLEILEFNEFLLDKYSKDSPAEFKKLIEQLLIDIKIPIEILVKYWIRVYTIESPFYKELNYFLLKKSNNDFKVFIKVLYQALISKAIKPFIDNTLYRGSKIQITEVNLIKKALANKKINLPGCICYNKSFFSTSLNKDTAMFFMNKKEINKDEMKALYIIEKKDELDKESATCIDIQDYSAYNEKEILFLPFSCFEILNINEKEKFCEIYLSYIGKYKKQINKSDKIPENKFAKNILSANILKKMEMIKGSNKNKFDFNIEKYIQPEEKQSLIIAVYDINENDLNKKVKILNYDENINKSEIKNICNINLNGEKLYSPFDYIFSVPGKYTFNIEFNNLLTNANKLFYECSSLVSLDFSKFKSNYINDMTDMFNGCSKLEKINLSNFKTKDVTSMKRTFKGCFSLKSLDLSDFDTSNVIDMSEMFRECISLEFLNFLNFKNKKVKHFDKIFYLCNPLVYINISNSNSHNIDDITDKVFYNPGQNNINDLSELKNKYKNLNKKAISYISKNKFIEALTCYENSYSISEKLKDKIKKRESECNVSIIYYYLNNKKIGYDLLKNYYYYFSDKFNKKNKNNFKILTLLCQSGSYLCMSQILIFQDKDGCINLLKDIIKIISEEKNDNKIFCIKYLNNIIFNGIILLSQNNYYNIHNLYENNIIDSSNIFNINNKQFYRAFCDFIATGNIESWINFLDMINQEIKKLKNETVVANLSFHKLMATCIKYMNENSEKNTSNKNSELAEVKLKLSSLIKNSYDKKNIDEKNINKIITEYNVKLKILKEIYEMLNNFEKNLFNDKISEKYLNKFYQNNKNKKEDNYFIISEYFIETSLLQVNLIDNTEEAINEINNPKISSLVLSNMDLSHLDPGFINNINNNFIKMNKFNTIKSIYISSNKTKNISDNLDNFFGTAYSHICQGENITKINFKKKVQLYIFTK